MVPHRPLFWGIQSVWVFYLVTCLAGGIFFLGMWSRVSVWLKGFGEKRVAFCSSGLKRLVLDGLLGRRIFKGDMAAGIMHMLIFWGFVGLFLGTLFLSIHHYLFPFLKGRIYLLYSACLEIAGLSLVGGIVWALIRRYLRRVSRLERRLEDLWIALWLLVIALSGFLVEGLRIAGQKPEWAEWSLAGYLLGRLWWGFDNVLPVYVYAWWGHALLSLGLIAAIPFSKLFHSLASPLAVYLGDQPHPALPCDARPLNREAFSFREMVFLDACTRCGRCVEVCPSTGAGEPFTPRDFILAWRAYLHNRCNPLKLLRLPEAWHRDRAPEDSNLHGQKIWHCTTCRACLEVCPVYVETPEAMRHAREKVIEEGTRVPALLIQALERLYKYHNPWEASKKGRAKWSEDLEVPFVGQAGQGNELCYFVGCTSSVETRAQGLARSFVCILKHAHVPFGILGKQEPCCGDIARRVGEQGLFQEQMNNCLALFRRLGVKDVVTSSPHCFHALKNDYPLYTSVTGENVAFRTRHYTQLLGELIANGSMEFRHPFHATVTYHDPCYLGRYNQIFDAPRQIIERVPGVKLVEMEHFRQNSLCCGGGGGRTWQQGLDADVKMSEVRIREAQASGAQILITACPLCLIMLEDARKTAGLENILRVMDLNELVEKALGLEGLGEEGER